MCYAREIQLALSEMHVVREMFPSGTLLLKTFGFRPLSFRNNRFTIRTKKRPNRYGLYLAHVSLNCIRTKYRPNRYGLYLAHDYPKWIRSIYRPN